MSTLQHKLNDSTANETFDTRDIRIGIAVSDWNTEVTGKLLEGCLDSLRAKGMNEQSIRVTHVPGSFELTYAANLMVRSKRVDAVIVLGCVVQGETPHFDYVCEGVTVGIAKLNAEQTIPVIFGLLTTLNQQQALDRAGGNLGNKGSECALTALKMIEVKRQMSM